MIMYIVVGIIVIILLYALITYNNLVKLNNSLKEAFGTMDVYLKKRWDLIPNLVETVKGYASHEENTLKEVINLRNKAYDNMSSNEKIKTNQAVSKDINKLMIIAENYPDLKASQNFQDLTKQLAKTEEDIANARKYYNAVTEQFNNKVEMFPSNIFAKLFGYKHQDMFEIESNQRENVKINF